ncbi:insoluble domain protein (plasmid) [Rhodococcus aetherivorans]|uniref:insoluble domain protein n=1 Tax=Rhodococcus aetherivorans TaxID=191292 RepID=UPI000AFB38BF|nr:insoluble domain protein [Rhodococcus aetherivorans]WKX01961.1 insoluble domain protein [Rhodococcus aetherivorans]
MLSTATLAPAAAGLLIAFAPTAAAAPTGDSGGGQAGITSPPQSGGGQAGITSTPPSTSAPAPSTPDPQPAENFWVAPPAEYNRGTRAYNPQTGGGVSMAQYNGYSGGDNSGYSVPAPQAPVVVEGPTLPIEAPVNKMRFGRVIFDQPNWVSDVDADKTNRTTAVVEAMVTDYHRSTGMETEEAEKIASAQVAGTAVGAGAGFVTGCTAVGIPTALVASTAAGIAGAAAGTMVPIPIPGVAPITSGVAATAAGAAGGFAAGCAVGGTVGAVGGGLAGYGVGTAYGAGEDATPIETEVPDIEAEQVTEQVDTTLAQWSEDPIGAAAVDAVQSFATETAPAIDEQVRDFVQTQPGGEQVIEQVDQALDSFFTDATPGLASRLVSEAVGLGLGAPAPAVDA